MNTYTYCAGNKARLLSVVHSYAEQDKCSNVPRNASKEKTNYKPFTQKKEKTSFLILIPVLWLKKLIRKSIFSNAQRDHKRMVITKAHILCFLKLKNWMLKHYPGTYQGIRLLYDLIK